MRGRVLCEDTKIPLKSCGGRGKMVIFAGFIYIPYYKELQNRYRDGNRKSDLPCSRGACRPPGRRCAECCVRSGRRKRRNRRDFRYGAGFFRRRCAGPCETSPYPCRDRRVGGGTRRGDGEGRFFGGGRRSGGQRCRSGDRGRDGRGGCRRPSCRRRQVRGPQQGGVGRPFRPDA